MALSVIIQRLLENFPTHDPVPVFYGRKIARQRMLFLLDSARCAERDDDSKLLTAISLEIGYVDPWS